MAPSLRLLIAIQSPSKERIAKLREEIAHNQRCEPSVLGGRQEASRRIGGITNVGFNDCRKS